MTTEIKSDKRRRLAARIARIEGQLRGIQNLMAGSSECELVAQQMCAARKALDKAFFHTLACMLEEGEVTPAELSALLSKYA